MKYATFDIESKNWVDFEVLGFFDGDTYWKFEKISDFINHLNRKAYSGLRIYAHNGGKFDFLFILEELLDRSWIKKIIERQGRIICIRCDTGKVQFTFADSYALLPQSLRSLSDSFGPEHKKLEMDYRKVSKNDSKTLRYLENDCLCLYEIITLFFGSDYVEQPQLTIASQAMNTFRLRFCPSFVGRIELEDEDMIRERFYSGGRVEVYKGRGRVNCYDVNSLYPTAMLNEMPSGKMIKTKKYHSGKIGFYEVNIKATPAWYISPLLIKGKKNFYVNGPGTYYLSSATIEYLRTEFSIRCSVVSGYVFSGRDDLFGDYVETFYKMKQGAEKNSVQYVLAKLFLNSLYGKFGAARWRDSVVPWTDELQTWEDFDPRYGLVLVKEKSKSKFIMPFVASYITELARLYHFQLLNMYPEKMYYCDTDSLYTSADMNKLVGTKIGQLSNDGTWNGLFLNSKCYALRERGKEKIRFKGFSTDSFDYGDFEKASRGLILTEERSRILSYRECFHRKEGIVRDRGKFLKTVVMKKEATGQYDKRLTFINKKTIFDTFPFQYSDVILSP